MVLVVSPRALLNGFTFSFLNGEEGVSGLKSGSNLNRCGVGRGFGMGRAFVNYLNLKIWVVAKAWPTATRRCGPYWFAPSFVDWLPFFNSER